MGNEFGLPASNLGITAIAATTPNIEKTELTQLLQSWTSLSSTRDRPDRLSRDDLLAGMKDMDKFTPSDSELFAQLFTLFDDEGHDNVDFKSFFCGAMFCLTTLSAREKLQWGMSVFDSGASDSVLRGDLKRLLVAINQAAAFFGDPVIAPDEIDQLTVEMFKELPVVSGRVGRGETVDFLLSHALILRWMRGEGAVRFGAPELQV